MEAAGYRVEAEVPVLARRADLVGTREDHLVAVELKMRDWREALHQAVAYQLAVDWAWVAMPLAAASTAYRHRWRFEAERVGLLAVDDRGRVRVPIPARSSPRLLPFLRERVSADSVGIREALSLSRGLAREGAVAPLAVPGDLRLE